MYKVELEQFEGPLELLLELIEKSKLDISDISLAKITDHFLAHIDNMPEKDPRYLANFLVVAARLILIKSKTLLPFFSVTQEEEQELTELKESLEQYQKVREGAKAIAGLEKRAQIAYHRPSGLSRFKAFAPPENITVEILEQCFAAILEANTKEEALEEKRINPIVSFEERIKDIKNRLERNMKEHFHSIADKSSKAHTIISFLAVLELVKLKFLTADQDQIFGEIVLTKYQYVQS